MQIQPFFGNEIITSSNVEVRVAATDRDRALALVELAKGITDVHDDETFEEARQIAGQLKAMVDEIELSRKQAKGPFMATERTIDDVAKKVATPVKNEQTRVLGLLSGHVAKLEAERKEEERRQAAAKMLAQAQADRKVREAEMAAAQAHAELQTAKDEIERVKLQEAAQRRENQLLQEQLAASLAADIDELGASDEPPRGLVPGGRVDHAYEFELIDVNATVRAGCWRLVKWSLDVMACRDAVKNLIECAPNVEPELPGIRITKKINVSVKAAARIK